MELDSTTEPAPSHLVSSSFSSDEKSWSYNSTRARKWKYAARLTSRFPKVQDVEISRWRCLARGWQGKLGLPCRDPPASGRPLVWGIGQCPWSQRMGIQAGIKPIFGTSVQCMFAQWLLKWIVLRLWEAYRWKKYWPGFQSGNLLMLQPAALWMKCTHKDDKYSKGRHAMSKSTCSQ